MKNLFEFVIVYTILLLMAIFFLAMGLVVETRMGAFISGSMSTIFVGLMVKAYKTMKADAKLDAMFEIN